MKSFANLFRELDKTSSTLKKIEALISYFKQADDNDAVWALAVLTGRPFKRSITAKKLRNAALAYTGYEEWLFEASYRHVGDSAEVISLLVNSLPEKRHHKAASLPDEKSLHQWMLDIQAFSKKADNKQEDILYNWWSTLPQFDCFILTKLMTSGLRVGVSKKTVIKALSQLFDVDGDILAQRLLGTWPITPEFYNALKAPANEEDFKGKPYPFYLAYPIEGDIDQLGNPADWSAEWKWDGIRAQIVKEGDIVHIWSRGEELIDHQFPELIESAQEHLPESIILDGEIIPINKTTKQVAEFSDLQKRLGRKKPGKQIQTNHPVAFMAYDCLKLSEEDYRQTPYTNRREILTTVISNITNNTKSHWRWQLSTAVTFDSWEKLTHLREESRDRGVEGFMLKRQNSTYKVGRKRGDWWKWKVAPYTIDAVMLYAQPGSGRRANLYTDYTFALRSDDHSDSEWVPFAKAYSGLTDDEIRKVDHWIRRNTTNRFGPVRQVSPAQVFELAFENVSHSTRHKSGVAVRFPRILRWRQDKPTSEVDSIDSLKSLIKTPRTPT